jgi:hypothetical protein
MYGTGTTRYVSLEEYGTVQIILINIISQNLYFTRTEA